MPDGIARNMRVVYSAPASRQLSAAEVAALMESTSSRRFWMRSPSYWRNCSRRSTIG